MSLRSTLRAGGGRTKPQSLDVAPGTVELLALPIPLPSRLVRNASSWNEPNDVEVKRQQYADTQNNDPDKKSTDWLSRRT
jgi:hypothetical protein